jgi:hypothetical protein
MIAAVRPKATQAIDKDVNELKISMLLTVYDADLIFH